MVILRKYFPGLTLTQIAQFEKIEGIYAYWNSRINVISRKDLKNIYLRHVLHSLSIAKVIQFAPGNSILDVGTGGGFPGIPLAILYPEVSFTLGDSVLKKIKVVTSVTEHLGLKNCIPVCRRVESFSGTYDYIVSRAVMALPVFTEQTKHLVGSPGDPDFPSGILYLKGGEFGSELNRLSYPYQVYEISEFYREEYFSTKKIVYIKIGS